MESLITLSAESIISRYLSVPYGEPTPTWSAVAASELQHFPAGIWQQRLTLEKARHLYRNGRSMSYISQECNGISTFGISILNETSCFMYWFIWVRQQKWCLWMKQFYFPHLFFKWIPAVGSVYNLKSDIKFPIARYESVTYKPQVKAAQRL